MFKSVINKVYKDIINLDNVDKDKLLEKLIQDTLETTYDNYCYNLKVNYDYLLTRSTIKVIKTIKKEKKKERK